MSDLGWDLSEHDALVCRMAATLMAGDIARNEEGFPESDVPWAVSRALDIVAEVRRWRRAIEAPLGRTS